MMRSLYSGVSGLKVHQTKMDVIGNNISNVNTVGFKSSQVNFSDILYQTTSNASGPNADAHTAGINAKQIGLGSSVSAISTTITVSGGSQRTDNALDIMIEGNQFFIVNNGTQNYFTKAGAFTIDASGLLCTTGGYKVMGWQVDSKDPTKVVQDTVSDLRVRSDQWMHTPPEATTEVNFTGNIDYKDTQLGEQASGKTTTMSFYDNLGQNYTAVLNLKKPSEEDGIAENAAAGENGTYALRITDILDSNGKSIFIKEVVDEETGKITYVQNEAIPSISFGGGEHVFSFEATEAFEESGEFNLVGAPVSVYFNQSNGHIISVGDHEEEETDPGAATKVSLFIGEGGGEGDNDSNSPFPAKGITCDFSAMTMYASSGSSTFAAHRGTLNDGLGAGKPKGNMTGLAVDSSGRIYGSYDNGDKQLIGQIAVASFANPAGLEAAGNSLFLSTMNSGEFDGIGEDISVSGGKMTTGVLEMSNVDLSSEFTSIITTQRGFQANSRVITTSDTLLEELINLKR